MRSLPRLLLASCASLGIALLLTAVGIGLAFVPEGSSIEWNQVPISEYDLGDLAGGIVFFGLLAAVLAAIHLGRTRKGDAGARRRLAVGMLVAGLVPLALVVLLVATLVTLCSGGGCS